MRIDIVPSGVVTPSFHRRLPKNVHSDSTHWHVVHTHRHSEDLAALHLAKQGFRVFLPKRRKIVRHARRISEVREAFFPSYLFVAFDTQRTQWRRVNSTFGVSHLLCIQNRPLALPHGLIEDLMAATDSEGVLRPREKLEAGQRVRILSGPLEDHIGKLAEAEYCAEVRIFIDLMAREISVYIHRDFIIPIL